MKKANIKAGKLLKIAATIWGTAILAFVLFFLIAHILEDSKAVMQIYRSDDLLTFLMFPLSTIVGLALAYKWPGLGGVITFCGFIGLLILRPSLATNTYFMLGVLPSGMLYLLYWKIKKASR